MKIYNKKDFINLPGNTLYMDFRPCVFGDLRIKLSEPGYAENDFVFESLSMEDECVLMNLPTDDYDGVEFRFDEEPSMREGLYDFTSLYAVFDNDDISQYLSKIKRCLK